MQAQPGFISIELFQSLADEQKVLSLSFWEDESSITQWRNLLEHRTAQQKGKDSLFHADRIRVATVVRGYSSTEREQAPNDSSRLVP